MRALEHLRVRPGAVRGTRLSHDHRCVHGAKGDRGELCSYPTEQPSALGGRAEAGQTPWVGFPPRDHSSGRGAVLLPQAAGIALVIKTEQDYMGLLNLFL